MDFYINKINSNMPNIDKTKLLKILLFIHNFNNNKGKSNNTPPFIINTQLHSNLKNLKFNNNNNEFKHSIFILIYNIISSKTLIPDNLKFYLDCRTFDIHNYYKSEIISFSDFSNKIKKIIQICDNYYEKVKNDCKSNKYLHICYLSHKNIYNIKNNDYERIYVNRTLFMSAHAEFANISTFQKKYLKTKYNKIIIVIRYRNCGVRAASAPCPACAKLIFDTKIKTVIWSLGKSQFSFNKLI
tara:strand:- start:50 stop:775 length:726 start_codon:yes stop_codon:yes gene_type:complete